MASLAPALIACRVVDAEGAPIAGARVYVVRGPGSFPDVAALTDESGAALLAASTPGVYELQAAADGFATGTVEVAVKAGETVSRQISLGEA